MDLLDCLSHSPFLSIYLSFFYVSKSYMYSSHNATYQCCADLNFQLFVYCWALLFRSLECQHLHLSNFRRSLTLSVSITFVRISVDLACQVSCFLVTHIQPISSHLCQSVCITYLRNSTAVDLLNKFTYSPMLIYQTCFPFLHIYKPLHPFQNFVHILFLSIFLA